MGVFEVLACPDCGEQASMLFDASSLLERQFEGLYFLIVPADNEEGFVVEGDPNDANYLGDYNMAKHLRDATERVREAIESGGSMYVVCPTCNESLE